MIVYYAIRVFEALCVFAGIALGAAIICQFAEEYERMREKHKDNEP